MQNLFVVAVSCLSVFIFRSCDGSCPDHIASIKDCPPYFVQFGNNCYHFSTESATLEQSIENCKSLGAELVRTYINEENNFIVPFVQKHFKEYAWWSDSEPSPSIPELWKKDDLLIPLQVFQLGTGEICGAHANFEWTCSYNSKGNHVKATTAYNFICRKPA